MDIQQALLSSLAAAFFPAPSSSFFSALIPSSTSSNPNATNSSSSGGVTPPLPSLFATARHRLLAADLTTAGLLSPATGRFPPTPALGPQIVERALERDVCVQVVGARDVGRSKWEVQEEALRRREREKEGVIRPVTGDAGEEHDDDEQPGSSTSQRLRTASTTTTTTTTSTLMKPPLPIQPPSTSPLKLHLQDASGLVLPAFELFLVPKLHVAPSSADDAKRRRDQPAPPSLPIGTKLTLKRGTRVARGVVLLEPDRVVVLGGRCEALERRWAEVDLERAAAD